MGARLAILALLPKGSLPNGGSKDDLGPHVAPRPYLKMSFFCCERAVVARLS